MSNTKNIFEFLSDDESGDEQKPQQKEKRIRTRGKKTAQPTQAVKEEADLPDRPRRTRDNRHQKEYKGNTGVSARNRSKDRHSGTGQSGVDKKRFRKGGAGGGNVGTVRDDLQGRSRNREYEEEEEEEEEEEVQDDRLTLEQYYEQKGKDLEEVINAEQKEKKSGKVDTAALKKDKLELMEKKPELEDKTNTKGKKSGYKPALNSENNDLLNFRTGFVFDEKRKKKVVKQEEGEGEEKAAEGEKKEEAQEEGEDKTEKKPRTNNNRGGPRNNNNRGGPRNNNNNNRGGKQQKSKGFSAQEDDFPTLG